MMPEVSKLTSNQDDLFILDPYDLTDEDTDRDKRSFNDREGFGEKHHKKNFSNNPSKSQQKNKSSDYYIIPEDDLDIESKNMSSSKTSINTLTYPTSDDIRSKGEDTNFSKNEDIKFPTQLIDNLSEKHNSSISLPIPRSSSYHDIPSRKTPQNYPDSRDHSPNKHYFPPKERNYIPPPHNPKNPKNEVIYIPAFTNVSFNSLSILLLDNDCYYISDCDNKAIFHAGDQVFDSSKNIPGYPIGNLDKTYELKAKYHICFVKIRDNIYTPFIELIKIDDEYLSIKDTHCYPDNIWRLVFQVSNQITLVYPELRKIFNKNNCLNVVEKSVDSLLSSVMSCISQELNSMYSEINSSCNTDLTAANPQIPQDVIQSVTDSILSAMSKHIEVDRLVIKQLISPADVLITDKTITVKIPLYGHYLITNSKIMSTDKKSTSISTDVTLSCMATVSHSKQSIDWYAAAFVYKHDMYKCNISTGKTEERLSRIENIELFFKKVDQTLSYKGDIKKLLLSDIDKNNDKGGDETIIISAKICLNDDNTQTITLLHGKTDLSKTVSFYRELFSKGWARRAGSPRFPIKPTPSEDCEISGGTYFIEDFTSPVKIYIGIVKSL